MPMSIQEIKEHYDQYGLNDIGTMSKSEYRKALEDGALFWIDHHDFVRSTLSGEIFATNCEQLEVMIKFLQKYCERMPGPQEWTREA